MKFLSLGFETLKKSISLQKKTAISKFFEKGKESCQELAQILSHSAELFTKEKICILKLLQSYEFDNYLEAEFARRKILIHCIKFYQIEASLKKKFQKTKNEIKKAEGVLISPPPSIPLTNQKMEKDRDSNGLNNPGKASAPQGGTVQQTTTITLGASVFSQTSSNESTWSLINAPQQIEEEKEICNNKLNPMKRIASLQNSSNNKLDELCNGHDFIKIEHETYTAIQELKKGNINLPLGMEDVRVFFILFCFCKILSLIYFFSF